MPKQKKISTPDPDETKFPGYPHYPEKEDIFNKEKILPLPDEKVPLANELDVPGSELDDRDEEIGEEDEENNYYSLGGENHNDLEEDQGD